MLYLLVVALLIFAVEVCTGWVSRRVLLVLNFRSLSPQSPRIKARLEKAKQAVAEAYAARDAARCQTGEGMAVIYSQSQSQLDMAWNHLLCLGGVAFFCGAPMTRKLRSKDGRHRLEVTLCFALAVAAVSFFTSPAAAHHISSDCYSYAEKVGDGHPGRDEEGGILVITVFDWEAKKANAAYGCMVRSASEYYSLVPQSMNVVSNKTWMGWTPTTIIGTFMIKRKGR